MKMRGLCIFVHFLPIFECLGVSNVFQSLDVPNIDLKTTRRIYHLDGLLANSGYIHQSLVTGNQMVQCGVRCDVMQDCRSFFVDTTMSICQLHNIVLNNISGMVDSEASFYFRKSTECPEDWILFMNSCYFNDTNNAMNYEEAKEFCKNRGAGLPIIGSEAENDFLITFDQQIPPDSTGLWIDLTDIQQQGTWVWEETGEQPDFTDWDTDHTQPRMDSEHCAAMMKSYSYKWHDVFCEITLTAICEM